MNLWSNLLVAASAFKTNLAKFFEPFSGNEDCTFKSGFWPTSTGHNIKIKENLIGISSRLAKGKVQYNYLSFNRLFSLINITIVIIKIRPTLHCTSFFNQHRLSHTTPSLIREKLVTSRPVTSLKLKVNKIFDNYILHGYM